MLEVRKTSDGLWIGNGKKRVYITEHRLDTLELFGVLDDNRDAGEIVYTYYDPLELGKSYDSARIESKENMVVLENETHVAYQFRLTHRSAGVPYSHVWVCVANNSVMADLPDGPYTVLHLGENDD